MKHKIGAEVFVNFDDGIMKFKIQNIRGSKYVISVRGAEFEMKENEVSLEAKRIKGVSPFVSVSHQEEAGH